MRALVFVYIIEEVAHTHAQNAPLQWLSSKTVLATKRDLLVAYPVIDILENTRDWKLRLICMDNRSKDACYYVSLSN